MNRDQAVMQSIEKAATKAIPVHSYPPRMTLAQCGGILFDAGLALGIPGLAPEELPA